jgi:uncharacterized membrane protein YtjA (UPF0391 family)
MGPRVGAFPRPVWIHPSTEPNPICVVFSRGGTFVTYINGTTMLHYAVVFLVIALIAALFGFGGIAAGAAGIAKILFVVFLIGAVVAFVMNGSRRI